MQYDEEATVPFTHSIPMEEDLESRFGRPHRCTWITAIGSSNDMSASDFGVANVYQAKPAVVPLLG